MTYCITSRRGTSKLLELVPNPFDDINNNRKSTNFAILLNLQDIQCTIKLFKPCTGLDLEYFPLRLAYRKYVTFQPFRQFRSDQFILKLSITVAVYLQLFKKNK